MNSTEESVTIDPLTGDLIIHVRAGASYETEVIIERTAFAQIAHGHARLIEEVGPEVQEERLEGYPVSRRATRQIPMETADDPATRAREDSGARPGLARSR